MTERKLYLNPIQSRTAEPTDYENRLADALEAAFAAGIRELPALIDHLNAEGLKAPDGAAWTEISFTAEMQKLGG